MCARAAALTLRHLAERDQSALLAARVEGRLFAALDAETDADIARQLRASLATLLRAGAPSHPSRWLQARAWFPLKFVMSWGYVCHMFVTFSPSGPVTNFDTRLFTLLLWSHAPGTRKAGVLLFWTSGMSAADCQSAKWWRCCACKLPLLSA